MKKRPKGRPITQVDRKQQQKEKLRFRLFVASILAYIVYGVTRPDIIGSDIRYAVFIVLMPLLAGMWILGFRPATISKTWNSREIFRYKLQAILADFSLYLVASFFSFGLLGQVVWDAANRIMVKNIQSVVIQCPITEFGSHGKRRTIKHIGFLFNSHYEQLNISDDLMKAYEDKNPADYNIILETKEGLWNHFVVLDISVQQK